MKLLEPEVPTTVNEDVLNVEPDVKAFVTVAADAGTVANTPKPSADTATSAMRLRSVFVDICFLSISRSSDDPRSGLSSKNAFSYVMRVHFLHPFR
jgi:hypothetical protein